MKFFVRTFGALLAILVVQAPGWAQQSPPSTSPIQKLIAADQLLEEKEYDEALRGYQELLASDPDNAQVLNRIGNVYQAIGSLHDAKRYYDRALKADPKFAAAVNNIGCLYYNERRFGTAARHYRRAIKLDPSVASFHSNLGYAYLWEQNYKKMMEEFRRAVALDPTIFDQHSRSGAVMLERSVENRGAFYFYIAKTYGQMGDAGRCLDYLKKARDEHFKNILQVRTDPAFAPVRPNPAMKEFMDGLIPQTTPNPSSAAE